MTKELELLVQKWRALNMDVCEMEGQGNWALQLCTDELEATLAKTQEGVVVDGAPSECRECGSSSLSWFAANKNRTGVAEGRLRTDDVRCIFVLGCDECSETLFTISADAAANLLTTPQAAPVPVEGELPGMWSRSDFTGGDPDERSYAERTTSPPSQPAVELEQIGKTDKVCPSFQKFVDELAARGVVHCDAIENPEDYDGGIKLAAIREAYLTLFCAPTIDLEPFRPAVIAWKRALLAGGSSIDAPRRLLALIDGAKGGREESP